MGYGPRGHKELDTTEQLTHTFLNFPGYESQNTDFVLDGKLVQMQVI